MNSDSQHPHTSASLLPDQSAERFWSTTVQPLLEQIAERQLKGERAAITLEAGDLVQEAYLRLSELNMPLSDRRHFISMVSTTMRRVLVDHARRKQAAKRGALPQQITLRSRDAEGQEQGAVQLLELDTLLDDLARADPRKARILELHYFGGLTRAEMAEVTGLSPATLGRELSFARSWIAAQLDPTG
jgi:RNA polymerase sigma factor (TIGR02999 family)